MGLGFSSSLKRAQSGAAAGKGFLNSLQFSSGIGGGSSQPVIINPIMFANRIGTPTQPILNSSNWKQFNQRVGITNLSDVSLQQLFFRFANVKADGNGDSAATVKIGLIGGNTTSTDPGRSRLLTWDAGGSTSKVIAAGAIAETYPTDLGAPLAPGNMLQLTINITFPTAPAYVPCTNIQCGSFPYDSNEAGVTVTDKSMSGVLGSYAMTRQIFGPIGAYGTPVVGPTAVKPRVLIFGDSIVVGANDTTSGALIGWLQRALTGSYSWVAAAQNGYSWTNMVGAARARTLSPVRDGAFTHAISGLNTNDFGYAVSAAQIYAAMISVRDELLTKGVKLIVCTSWPRTNAGNTAQQAGDPANVFTRRSDLNQLIRDNNGVGYGYYDLAAQTEDGNTGLWRTDLGSPTADGIHPETVIHTNVRIDLASKLSTLLAV